jgi:CubicO group peptidase (beta-lactamase class C family)
MLSHMIFCVSHIAYINPFCTQNRPTSLLNTCASMLFVATALASTTAGAAEWVARHGLNSAQYQAAFDDFRNKGYRLTAVSGYDSGGARYAGIWKKVSGPAWAARHGLTSAQYQSEFNTLNNQGYRLTYVNGYSVAGQARYSGIWEKRSGAAMRARHGLTSSQYQAAVTEATRDGYGLTHVSAFSVGGSPRFAAIFEKNSGVWLARHDLSASEYQKAFNTFGSQGWRLKMVSGYRDGNSDRYAALWTKQVGPYYSARHGIPNAHYQAVFDNHLYQSYEPSYLQAFNASSGVRFNAIWTNTVFKGSDLELIGRKARDYLKSTGMPGVSIAVMRNKRLVYAAGFGVADKDSGLPMSPRHRLRVASVSKPITHVAILKLLADTDLNSTSKVFGSDTILGNTWPTPSNNPDIEDITIDHLIRHRAGFRRIDKDGNGSDPMFAYTGTTHHGLIEWALGQYPLGYTPGTTPANLTGADMYSNFGYCLLGRVIEKKTGKSYETYVRDTQFKPAGAPDVVIGSDKQADRKSDEVVYYGGGAYSSVKPKRFDSHGGWIARPLDLLRFMRYQTALGNGYAHYGEMSGTSAVFRVGAGGNGLAGAGNSDNGKPDDMDNMLKAIDSGVSVWPNVNLF